MAALVNQLPREPTQDVRTRRFMQILGQLMNSLLESGAIVQTGAGDYQIAVNTADLVITQRLLGPKIPSYGMFGG